MTNITVNFGSLTNKNFNCYLPNAIQIHHKVNKPFAKSSSSATLAMSTICNKLAHQISHRMQHSVLPESYICRFYPMTLQLHR